MAPEKIIMRTERQELISIQLLRALASILVLLSHLQIKERQYGDDQNLIWQNFHIGSIGVDIFFVLSGFIIFHVAGKTPSNWSSALKFMKNRLVRVLPLYWALTVVALTVYLMKPGIVNKTSSQPTGILESFFLLPTDKKLLIQNGWTLSYEFLFYIAFFTAILWLSPVRRVLPVVSLAVAAVFFGLVCTPSSAWAQFLTDDLLLEFAFGILIGALYHSHRSVHIFNSRIGWILFTLAVSTIVCLAFWGTGGCPRGISFGIPAALLVVSGLALERHSQSLKNLKILGDSSYSLYLLHVLSLPAVGMLWKSLRLEGTMANAGLLIVLFITSIVSSILLYRYFEAPLTGYLRRKL